MTSMYDEWSASLAVSLASSTVEDHQDGRRCWHCTDEGCAQLSWAEPVLAEHRADRAAWMEAARSAR